jgi:hypothetical protein
MAGVLQETRTAYPSRKLVFIPTSGGDLLVIFLVCFVLCCVFPQCLVCPMLPVSLDCPFLIATSVFSNAYLSCVLCVQYCRCLLIVHSWLPLLFSLSLICPVSCVSNVAQSRLDNQETLATLDTQDTWQIIVRENRSGNQEWTIKRHWQHLTHKTQDKCPMLQVSLDCPVLIATSVFSNAYLSCVLCVQYCRCLLIVHSWLPLLVSLSLICPVSCVSNVAGVSWLSILDCHFCFL